MGIKSINYILHEKIWFQLYYVLLINNIYADIPYPENRIGIVCEWRIIPEIFAIHWIIHKNSNSNKFSILHKMNARRKLLLPLAILLNPRYIKN